MEGALTAEKRLRRSQVIQNAKPVAVSVDRSEILAEMERILASPSFLRADRHQKLLRYIVNRTLAADQEALKEYSLGVAVFDRGKDFDPSTDSVVRTQASLLRKRLADFYSQSNAGPGFQIELPRGGYAIQALRTAPSTVPARNPLPYDRVPWAFGTPWVYLALGIVLGAAGMFFWSPKQRARSYANLPLWNSFLRDSPDCRLAINTPFFLHHGEGVYHRNINVNSIEDWERLPDKNAYWPVRPLHYTGIGEALGATAITQVFRDSGWPLRAIRGDQLRWSDLKSENVIIMSTSRFRGLQSELDPGVHFDFDTASAVGSIVNLRPLAGEPKAFRQSGLNGKGTTHALISLLPGKGMEHKILLLQGLHTWGTHAAAEFVADRKHLESLPAAFAKAYPGKALPDYFQVLITVEIADGQPLASRIAAVRPLP